MDGDRLLDETISLRLTVGHSVGHQSGLIQSGNRKAAFLGDPALFALNLKRPEWGPDWAWSREEDAENRRRIVRWSAENQATLILGHDALTPFVYVTSDGDGLRISPGQ